MVIAINCRHLTPNKLEGFGTYTYELVTRWIKEHNEVNFVLIFDREPTVVIPELPNVKKVIIGPPTRHPLLYWIWFEWSIPRILKRYKATLFFSPDGYNSLRSRVPSVITVHDLNFEHNPADLPKVLGWYLRKFVPKFVEKATRVLTVSAYSKQDITKCYRCASEKISTVYNGANEIYQPLSEDVKITTRKRISNNRPYFLFVGSLHPRKNVQRLITAYQGINNPSVDLVIVGSAMWRDHQISVDPNGADRIHFLGYLAQKELAEVMGSALALTYVPYFEGFGIPLVEAMRCGIPILAANTTCLPEIAGNAAIYCDPFNVQEIQTGLEQLIENDTLRIQLSENSINRATEFSWDQAAKQSWEVIYTTANT
jgi:glycosyltransferase involved in cell wall biosynthesis